MLDSAVNGSTPEFIDNDDRFLGIAIGPDPMECDANAGEDDVGGVAAEFWNDNDKEGGGTPVSPCDTGREPVPLTVGICSKVLVFIRGQDQCVYDSWLGWGGQVRQ